MVLSPAEFVSLWNAPFPVDIVTQEYRHHWFSPLVTARAEALDAVEIPDAAKTFLLKAGLPHHSVKFGTTFDALTEAILPASQVRPDKINNGVEFPPMRYDHFYVIGSREYGDSNVIVEKFTGWVYIIDYGEGTFSHSVPNERGGGYTIKRTNYPVLNGTNSVGPYFFSSSIPQLATLFAVYRNTYLANMELWEHKYRRLAGLLKREMRKVDEAAVTHPKGLWKNSLDMLADGVD